MTQRSQIRQSIRQLSRAQADKQPGNRKARRIDAARNIPKWRDALVIAATLDEAKPVQIPHKSLWQRFWQWVTAKVLPSPRTRLEGF